MGYNNRAGWVTGLLLAVFFVVGLSSAALAYTATSYNLPNSFAIGNLMAIDDNGQPIVAVTGSNYIGVVTRQTDNSVDIADDGIVQVFVLKSDSGSIDSGSKIGFSSVAGMAALLQDGSTQIGIANESITDSSSKWKTVTIKMSDGTLKDDAKVALITVRLTKGDSVSNALVGLIGSAQRAAENIVGHNVALWQVIFAAVLGIGGLILAFGLIFISSRAGIMSIGRNPMASKVILHGMWRVSAMSIAVMMAGLIAAYLILKVDII